MNDPTVQLWAEDEVHFQRHSSLTRMWSIKGQQPRVISASTRPENRLLRSDQFENRAPSNPKMFHLQCRYIRGFSRLSSASYSRENTSYSGQCYLAQGTGSKTILHQESKTSHAHLSTSIFSRTQSNRTSVENYSKADNSQPLFRINRKPRSSSEFPFCKMGTAK